MVIAFVIHKDNFPSLNHSRFLDENEAITEVNRLNECVRKENERIESNPATGRGSCFLNIKNNSVWSYKRMEFPK